MLLYIITTFEEAFRIYIASLYTNKWKSSFTIHSDRNKLCYIDQEKMSPMVLK
jgi:hypothetical protein